MALRRQEMFDRKMFRESGGDFSDQISGCLTCNTAVIAEAGGSQRPLSRLLVEESLEEGIGVGNVL